MSTDEIRPVAIVMEPVEAQEAKGVLIRRTIGSERLVLLDPLLLLDHLQVSPSDGGTSVGFPRHPHRGIETLTYVLSGRVHHRDSLGNDSSVGTNGSQWMTAGGGIFHEEMLEFGGGERVAVEALQLWFNLPADRKMTPPGYAAATETEIPAVALPDGGTVRVIAGQAFEAVGPFSGIAVSPTVLDVSLPSGASVTLPAPALRTTVAYLYQGTATFGEGAGERTATAARLVIFADGSSVRVTTADSPARFLMVSAPPLREPVLQYRSLVMNTVEQMRDALDDLERGTFAMPGK
ncbi:MAG: pirin family protein [Capsulimonadales bacterium]|nr:pirin family protein [Capsulimonadales bacterium]